MSEQDNKPPVVVIGIGEMGAVFARGLLRLGHPVYPVNRNTNMAAVAERIPAPEVVLIAVGEAALPEVLENLPRAWHERLALLQNELLPRDYRSFQGVTVISVWFEKKKGQDSKPIIPSPVYGPRAGLLRDALASIDLPARVLDSEAELLNELVIKNLYILTSNIAGLRVGGTVGELWSDHPNFVRSVVGDIITLQHAMTGQHLNADALIAGMVHAFEGDPEHKCMGRSAPARLQRALEHADRLGVYVPTLRDIAANDLPSD